MRATRAYVASAGTAVVLLGASICMFVLVSALVAFGSWPGTESHTNVDSLILTDVVKPKPAQKVAVRADAVVVAERAAKRAAIRQRQARARTAPRTVAGNPVTVAPATPGAPIGAAPAAGAQTPAAGNPAAPVTAPVKKQTEQVVENTTQQVTTGVQKVQNQVNEVVGGIGAPQPPPVGGTVQGVTNGVKDAAGSLLGG
jgi:hypothetical protein